MKFMAVGNMEKRREDKHDNPAFFVLFRVNSWFRFLNCEILSVYAFFFFSRF